MAAVAIVCNNHKINAIGLITRHCLLALSKFPTYPLKTENWLKPLYLLAVSAMLVA